MSKALIKMYYRMGIYSDADLDTFVKAGYITESEAAALKRMDSETEIRERLA